MALPPDALTTVQAVSDRLEEDEDTLDDLTAMIEAAIEDASDEARDFGSSKWSGATVPAKVSRLVASAVARHMNNPEGYTVSTAGDESLSWAPSTRPGWFTYDERKRLTKWGTPAPVTGFWSIPTTLWEDKDGSDSDVHPFLRGY